MPRVSWVGLVLAVCLPVGVLAAGLPIPWLDDPAGPGVPADVPAGDQEVAWLHTSTNGTTWERFVAGLMRAQLAVPGLTVDDSGAFTESTTASPEVVMSMAGHTGRLRVRWYKLTNDATADHWARVLAARDPPPIAVAGGGSTDRAVDLARALAAREQWRGARPLLLITTGSADEYRPGDGTQKQALTAIYPGRTFRFCFTNRLMAEAVVDFAWRTPDLRPDAPGPGAGMPVVQNPVWRDDPFSEDLHDKFGDVLLRRGVGIDTWAIPFSVGGKDVPNPGEALAAAGIREHAGRLPGRVVIVLPTVTNPARRLLRAVTDADPGLRARLVAVTGDGIPVNAVYRDAEFAWPAQALAVPLVLFCHNDPTGWDAPGGPAPPPGYRLDPPNMTEDVRHFADIGAHLARAAFGAGEALPDPNAVADRLRLGGLFEADGERKRRTGEHVCVLRPGPDGTFLEVHRRKGETDWERVRTVDVSVRRGAPGVRE